MTSNNANPFSSAGRSGYSSISQGVNYDSEEEKPTKRSNKKTTSTSTSVRPSLSAMNTTLQSVRTRSRCNFLFLTTLYLLVITLGFSLHRSIYLLSLQESDSVQTFDKRISTVDKLLKDTITGIQKFNRTVTNADLIDAVSDLRIKVKQQSEEIKEELDDTKEEVREEFDTTKEDIDRTVEKAQKEIGAEVVEVRKKVDEYKSSTQSQFELENNFMLYQLAGTFTLLTSLISGWHVTSHLRNFHNPVVQRKVLAILWMAPIYSTTSWFSLVFPHAEAYLSIVRDCYESYVVYVFLSFLISVMGNGDRSLVVAKLAENKLTLQPPCTFCGLCLKVGKEGGAVETAGAVLTQCQGLALQFVLCKPVIAVANFAVNHMGIWKPTQTHEKMEGTLVDWYNPSVYILVCANLSVSCAFFGLLKFYHLVANDLRWCRPWPKFLCIKGVVFATFWQGLAVNILAKTARGEGDGNEGGWAKQAQSFLICIEMLIASIAHFYVFPHYEWSPSYVREEKSKTKFGDNLALRDFIGDLKIIMGGDKNNRKRGEGEDYKDGTGGEGRVGIGSDVNNESTKKAGSEEDDVESGEAIRRIRESLSLLEGDQREQLEIYRKERERKDRDMEEGGKEEGERTALLGEGGEGGKGEKGGKGRKTKHFRPRNSKLHR